SYFFLAGYIDNSKLIAKYYNSSDVVINISIFEGTCTSNLEAIACGIPVISTDVGDIHELIFGNENGIIIPNDIDENIVTNVSNAVLSLSKRQIKMNEIYEKYNGINVIDELKSMISKI
ncbi:glycosyltransferase family 4 protein, partial [Thomasclavelia cocleata]|uniref:glycosyltransferase family 4 protein n=1 Tax=Thomasclavelia cocleata TaxID=69824 RepID=UPI00272E2FF5